MMNNTTSVYVSGEMMDYYTEFKAAVLLWIYIPPILIVVGTIGNILTIVVLSRSSMRHSTTSLYLRVLAVVDILVLVTGLLRQWLLYLIDTDIRAMTDFGCKIHVWILYFSAHSSAWLLVSLTLERAASVMFPHTMKMKCTRKAASSVIATVLIFFLLLNAHYLYGMGSFSETDGNITSLFPCDGLTSRYALFEQLIWPWIDLTFYSVLPSSIMIVSNFCIIKKVFSSDKKAFTMSSNNGARRRKTSSMTLTLVAVSAAYVICTTPFCTFVIYINVYSEGDESETEAVLWAVVNLMQYTNNAVNFILYCVTGTRFRQELMGLVCKKTLALSPTIYSTSTTRKTSLKASTSEVSM